MRNYPSLALRWRLRQRQPLSARWLSPKGTRSSERLRGTGSALAVRVSTCLDSSQKILNRAVLHFVVPVGKFFVRSQQLLK